jgi:Family of unknown function (DUF5677)
MGIMRRPPGTEALRGVLGKLLDRIRFADAKGMECREDVFKDHAEGHLRRVAAYALLRVPNCLNAIARLGEAKLGLEAHTIVRTIVELAITLCWIGLDQSRAQQVWDKSVADFSKGLDRAGKHAPTPAEISAWATELKKTSSGTRRPTLKDMAEQALDTPTLAGKKMASVLYDYLYDPLSAAAHADLRFAKLVANMDDELYVPSAFEHAVASTEFLLIAASEQLGFRKELDAFFAQSHRDNDTPPGLAGS